MHELRANALQECPTGWLRLNQQLPCIFGLCRLLLPPGGGELTLFTKAVAYNGRFCSSGSRNERLAG